MDTCRQIPIQLIILAMLRLHNVTKVFPPDQVALCNVNLNMAQGDFVFLTGASGAGKTTLLKLLYGAERASEGQVVIGGRNLSCVPRREIVRLRQEMGIVFQDYKLLPRCSVVDNVAYPLEVQGVKVKERRRLAQKLLAALGLEERAEAWPPALSGGEQQRAALARALIHHPKILLADEPTGNLDPEMSRTIFALLLEASARGVTVLVATHNLAIIEELNMRTVVLDRGKILGDYEKPRQVE